MLPKPVIGTDTVRTTAPTAAVMMAMVVVPALLWLAGLCMSWTLISYTVQVNLNFLFPGSSALIVIVIFVLIAVAIGIGIWRRRVYLTTRQTVVYTTGPPVQTVTQYAY
jgi:hypothetical protein